TRTSWSSWLVWTRWPLSFGEGSATASSQTASRMRDVPASLPERHAHWKRVRKADNIDHGRNNLEYSPRAIVTNPAAAESAPSRLLQFAPSMNHSDWEYPGIPRAGDESLS